MKNKDKRKIFGDLIGGMFNVLAWSIEHGA